MSKYFFRVVFSSFFLFTNAHAVGPGNDQQQINEFCSSLNDTDRVSCWKKYKSDQNKYKLSWLKTFYENVPRKMGVPGATAYVAKKVLSSKATSCGENEYCATEIVNKMRRQMSSLERLVKPYAGNCIVSPPPGGTCNYYYKEATFLVSDALKNCQLIKVPHVRSGCIKHFRDSQGSLNSINSQYLRSKKGLPDSTTANTEKQEIAKFLNDSSVSSYDRSEDTYQKGGNSEFTNEVLSIAVDSYTEYKQKKNASKYYKPTRTKKQESNSRPHVNCRSRELAGGGPDSRPLCR